MAKGKSYDPNSSEPFRLSRSKIDLFLKCPRCFYLDRRLGVGHPGSLPFTLNSAVDALLKREFDHYREIQKPHPLMIENGIEGVPYKHELLERWRDALHAGVEFHHKKSGFMVTGGVDDVWISPGGELLVVDYKATSKKDEVNLDSDWQVSYKRQAEIYQWLFRMNGFKVSNTAYFVYCNGDSSCEKFNAELKFIIKVIPYLGSSDWLEKTLLDAANCLSSQALPVAASDCKFCIYREKARKVEYP